MSETTGAWVITGGTNTGISKLIGESLKGALRIHKETRDRNKTHCIGIVTWGSIKHREDLEKINEKVIFMT